jgi:hypothetical protein
VDTCPSQSTALPLLREFDLSTRSMVLRPLTRFNGRDLLRYSGLRRFQFSTFTLSQNAFSRSPQIPATCPPQINGPRSLRDFFGSSGIPHEPFALLRPFVTSVLSLRATSAFGTSELLSFVGGETPEVNLPE